MRRRSLLAALGATAAGGALRSLARPSRALPDRPARARRGGPAHARQGSFAPLGRVAVEGATEAVVGPDGETAYVATGDGFAVVDASDPADPTVVAERRGLLADREDGPMASIRDVAVEGDRLVVPGPSAPRPSPSGFLLYDVSDPVDPQQLAFAETGFAIHNAFVRDGHVYVVRTMLAAEDHLVVYDARDDAPRKVGEWSLEGHDPAWVETPSALIGLHDVWVEDGVAYLEKWDAGTWLVDVGSPDAVTVVGRAGGRTRDELAALADERIGLESVQLPGNHHSAAVSDDGSVLAVGAEAFDAVAGDGTGGPGGIDLYDINDPSSPGHLASIDPLGAADETRGGTWTTAHDFTFDRNRLLSAWYQGGVRIHDVSEPAEPHQMTAWRQPAEAAFWTARPARDDTFVAPSTTLPGGGLQSGLYLFPNRPGDQANPPSLTEPTPRVATSTPTATDTATPSPSPSPTRAPGQPGFGYLASVGGLAGLAGWRYWRQGR